jgi:predicted CXXCH cytochrome family protein
VIPLRLVLALLAAAAGTALAAEPTNPFRLQRGAGGEVCLDCHGEDFKVVFRRAFVHTPVRRKECAGCHRPHASTSSKLLDAEGGRMCGACHAVAPERPVSSHRPVAEGQCTVCHDPHASANKFNLVQSPPALCARCHPEIARAAAAEFTHPPVQKGCTVCHEVHGSARGPQLLASPVPQLCTGCHPARGLAAAHANYPVGSARCTSCHDPHGSPVRGLLQATVHPPVAKRNCPQCHEPASSARPFQTRRAGMALCQSCHSKRIAAMLDNNRVHWPVAQGSCLACHAPHASSTRGLVKGRTVTTCGACHADTIRRQELSASKHQPIATGACTSCHDPHAASAGFMFKTPDTLALCGTCHDWQRHMAHPLGAQYPDPRNRNLTVQCLSCHRAHGTENKHLLPTRSLDLCTSCHQGEIRSRRAPSDTPPPPPRVRQAREGNEDFP